MCGYIFISISQHFIWTIMKPLAYCGGPVKILNFPKQEVSLGVFTSCLMWDVSLWSIHTP